MHIATKFSLTMVMFGTLFQSASAMINPVDANLVSGRLPAKTYAGNSYTAVYQMISNYPGNYAWSAASGGSNVQYLLNAVNSLKAVSSNQAPVGFAFLGPDLIAPPSNDITTLVNAQSPGAPIPGDIYPFQWGVPLAQSVESIGSSSATNSIGWDYYQMQQQSYYTTGRPILMAETGWASVSTLFSNKLPKPLCR